MKKLILLIMMGTVFAIGCSKNKDVAETVKENKTKTIKDHQEMKCRHLL